MKTIYVNADNLHVLQQAAKPVAMALGYFDGVHIGHQNVIAKACEKAAEHQIAVAVLSFYPHPKSILIPGYSVNYLEPIEEKAKKLADLGVDIFYVVEFTKELALFSPEEFLNAYVESLGAKEIICGFDYTYGHKASGNAKTLAAYTAEKQMGLTVVNELLWQNEKISSTRIRLCLKKGNAQELPKLLGSHYVTKYCLRSGVLPNYALPAEGTYHVLIETEDRLIPSLAKVLGQRVISLNCDVSHLPTVISIRWIDTYESKIINSSYAYF